MTQQRRMLFLSQCLPYPPQSGVTNRTFNILNQLRRDFDVTLLAFTRRGHQADARSRERAARALSDLVGRAVTAVPIPAEQARFRRVWDHLRSVWSGRPYTLFEYRSDRFRAELRELVRDARFDLVHLDSLDLHGWLGDLPPVPVACTHHSIESQLLRLQARWLRSRLLARYLLFQADLVERVERATCPQLGANVMMSQTDAERLLALAPGSPTVVVPNGVDTAYFAPLEGVPGVPGRVLWVGATYTLPNRDAVEYLLRDIWPRIRRARRDASLCLVGGGPPGLQARRDAAPGVTAHGHVPDVRPHLAEASCCVVPLRAGGGTRVKILDAWAMGKAVVSTAVGCEGLEAVDGENIVVRDDPAAFAAAVLDVLRDADLRARLGSNGRSTVERLYSWDTVGKTIRGAYQQLIGAGAARPPAELARQPRLSTDPSRGVTV